MHVSHISTITSQFTSNLVAEVSSFIRTRTPFTLHVEHSEGDTTAYQHDGDNFVSTIEIPVLNHLKREFAGVL